MPPIPTFKNAPIKADGVTPQTDDGSNPAPTPTSRYVPATTTVDSSLPLAPQPGARPIPTATASADYNSPPAPQPGYTAAHITTETRVQAPPPQFTQPPPSDSQLAGRSTVTSTTASKPGPTKLNLGPAASPFQRANAGGVVPSAIATDGDRRSLEHPPGYQQAPDNAPYTQGGGIGGGESTGGGIGAQAWNILSRAGDALKGAEEAAWKAANGKK
ncbi:uncharacterized protein M421DRAFT_425470 [Didymella exigua CBS 183.55]|uniref:Uncharacterized protein n=1 Tax=Didymella exigua CBS 183.55 TaxID=1150837 RepID=A0A6A5R6L3_9PLEO|nr:uncharacterized protein M421DRAFT_425470 [Didymella exigua CBS 183.55]KAF1923765.1 hypothetical protein M421DRAFT_425470 [Didymella exigua CBS 183.55]